MSFKKGDIVIIKEINVEGLICDIGIDFNTKETKYNILTSEKQIYFVKNSDIIKIDTLNNRVDKFVEENSKPSYFDA